MIVNDLMVAIQLTIAFRASHGYKYASATRFDSQYFLVTDPRSTRGHKRGACKSPFSDENSSSEPEQKNRRKPKDARD
jgi:hypothetical protein